MSQQLFIDTPVAEVLILHSPTLDMRSSSRHRTFVIIRSSWINLDFKITRSSNWIEHYFFEETD